MMICVYCGGDGVFLVDNEYAHVACFDHLGSVVDDRLTLTEAMSVSVERL